MRLARLGHMSESSIMGRAAVLKLNMSFMDYLIKGGDIAPHPTMSDTFDVNHELFISVFGEHQHTALYGRSD